MFSWLWGNTQQADCTLEVKIASDTTQLASVSQMHKHVLCSHFKVLREQLGMEAATHAAGSSSSARVGTKRRLSDADLPDTDLPDADLPDTDLPADRILLLLESQAEKDAWDRLARFAYTGKVHGAASHAMLLEMVRLAERLEPSQELLRWLQAAWDELPTKDMPIGMAAETLTDPVFACIRWLMDACVKRVVSTFSTFSTAWSSPENKALLRAALGDALEVANTPHLERLLLQLPVDAMVWWLKGMDDGDSVSTDSEDTVLYLLDLYTSKVVVDDNVPYHKLWEHLRLLQLSPLFLTHVAPRLLKPLSLMADDAVSVFKLFRAHAARLAGQLAWDALDKSDLTAGALRRPRPESRYATAAITCSVDRDHLLTALIKCNAGAASAELLISGDPVVLRGTKLRVSVGFKRRGEHDVKHWAKADATLPILSILAIDDPKPPSQVGLRFGGSFVAGKLHPQSRAVTGTFDRIPEHGSATWDEPWREMLADNPSAGMATDSWDDILALENGTLVLRWEKPSVDLA